MIFRTKIRDATKFDPRWKTSYQDIIDNTDIELRRRRESYLKKKMKNKEDKGKFKKFVNGATKGFKGSSSSEKIEKTATAVGHVATAVGKFMDASDDESSKVGFINF